MAEPWFNPSYSWLPGTLLGVMAGIWGTMLGLLGPRGQAKQLVVGLTIALLIGSVVLLMAAVVAYFAEQPYAIWYGLGLAGLIGCLVIGINSINVARVYRIAEERRMKAQDI